MSWKTLEAVTLLKETYLAQNIKCNVGGVLYLELCSAVEY